MCKLKNVFCISLIFATILIIGCQRDSQVRVTGTITLDGQPVKDGTIAFIADNGNGKLFGDSFKNGSYSLRVVPGSYLIRINAIEIIKLDKPSDENAFPMKTTESIQLIPEKYNFRSTLIETIPNKTTQIDFHLKTKDE